VAFLFSFGCFFLLSIICSFFCLIRHFCIFLSKHTHTHTYIYIYIYTHTHTHAHAHTCISTHMDGEL
jgi:hypothetical protein